MKTFLAKKRSIFLARLFLGQLPLSISISSVFKFFLGFPISFSGY